MILLTRVNGSQFYMNAELIQTVEETPNTVITLLDHTKFLVKETAVEVVEKFIQYRQRVHQPMRNQDQTTRRAGE
jgi:flagellar protein FlbD